jgi:hypothetical protein
MFYRYDLFTGHGARGRSITTGQSLTTLGIAAIKAGHTTIHHNRCFYSTLFAQLGAGGELAAGTVIAGLGCVICFFLVQDLFLVISEFSGGQQADIL